MFHVQAHQAMLAEYPISDNCFQTDVGHAKINNVPH